MDPGCIIRHGIWFVMICPGTGKLFPDLMSLYFIAIVAPDKINRQVLEWKNHMLEAFSCKVALRSPAHITLIPPFSMQHTEEGPLVAALHEFAQEQQKFQVHLKDFAAFAPRVIYVHVQPGEQLQQLQKNTESFLIQQKRFPIKKQDRPFHPHITIANRDLKKEDFAAAWQHFRDRPYEAVFDAGAVSLLRYAANHWEVIADCTLK